jgi:hypothetical protein
LDETRLFASERIATIKSSLAAKLDAGVSPDDVTSAVAEIAGYILESGARDFTDWTRRMAEEVAHLDDRHLLIAWSHIPAKAEEKWQESVTGILTQRERTSLLFTYNDLLSKWRSAESERKRGQVNQGLVNSGASIEKYPLHSGGRPDGEVRFGSEGRATISLYDTADPETFLQAFTYTLRRNLRTPLLDVAEKWLGVRNGRWTQQQEEQFVRVFERYCWEGKAPTVESQKVLAPLTQFLKAKFPTLHGTPLDADVPLEARWLFDRCFGGNIASDQGPISDTAKRGRGWGQELHYVLHGLWSFEGRAAKKLAGGFECIRKQQFDATVKAIEKRCRLTTLKTQIGGDAELAMKAYQQWCTVALTVVNPHVRGAVRDDKRLFTDLSFYMEPDSAVNEYCLQFDKDRASQEAQLELLGKVIFEYIVGDELDPTALVVVMRLLPMFSCNTRMVIADTFRDREMVAELELEMKALQQGLTAR